MPSDPFFQGEAPTTILGMSWAIIVGLAGALVAVWKKGNKDQDSRIAEHKEQAKDLMESQRIMGQVVDALKSQSGTKRGDD